MSQESARVLFGSVVGLTLVIGYRDLVRARPRHVIPTAIAAALSVAIYVVNFAFHDYEIQTMGAIQEVVATALCYVAMLLGMIAQYFYKQAERGDKKLSFEPLEFLMPIFASPIVFIPLLTITSDLALTGAFTKGKLMVYLVAFQNGFFWKSFFEQRQKAAEHQAIAH